MFKKIRKWLLYVLGAVLGTAAAAGILVLLFNILKKILVFLGGILVAIIVLIGSLFNQNGWSGSKPGMEASPSPAYYIEQNIKLLDNEQKKELETLLENASKQYNFGIYIIASASENEPQEASAEAAYKNNNLGIGENKDGIVLLYTETEDFSYFELYMQCDEENLFSDEWAENLLANIENEDYYDTFIKYIENCKTELEKQ